MTTHAPIPSSDVDLYSDAVLDDPWPHYKALRDLGSVVWLPRNGLYAVTRYADVRDVLRNPLAFSSARGVAANDAANAISPGNMLASDPPEHDDLRRVVGEPLLPRALEAVRPRIEVLADTLVAQLVERGSFDGMTDFAQVLPLTIVSELVGLPDAGRRNMLAWAAATFDLLGGENDRSRAALPVVMDMRRYMDTEATPDKLRPGSWSAKLYAAADAGLVPRAQCPMLMRDYVAPSLDTTIFATGQMLHLLGRNPEQWQALRAQPSLIPATINETLRLASVVRAFTRTVTRDTPVGDSFVSAGSRVVVIYASANRDERKWSDPNVFDIRRKAGDHLAFGSGTHMCMGANLARMEMMALLAALVRRVSKIETGDPVPVRNNVLNGFESLPVRFH